MTLKLTLLLLAYAAIVVLGLGLAQMLPDPNTIAADPDLAGGYRRGVALVTAVYMLASAIPFVPGAEIGLGLLASFGPRVALPVWLAMVGALMLAYIVGRTIRPAVLARVFAALHMDRAARLVAEVAEAPPATRAGLLIARAPRAWVARLVRHRYVAFAVVLNVPGNAVLGGGGGIALVAGMSGLFAPLPFALTVALATAPLPAFVWTTGQLF